MPKDYNTPDPVEVLDKDEFGSWLAKVSNQTDLPAETQHYKQKESLLVHLIQSFKLQAEALRSLAGLEVGKTLTQDQKQMIMTKARRNFQFAVECSQYYHMAIKHGWGVAHDVYHETQIVGSLDPEKQEKLKDALREERRLKDEEAKKKTEEVAALKRTASFRYEQPRLKLSRQNAPCRACHQMGHWASDPDCPLKMQNMVVKQAPALMPAQGGAEGSQEKQ